MWAQKIDIVPLGPGSQGFQFIIDSSTSLYFYQDGDHFVYDGYEMGQYGKGEVTILIIWIKIIYRNIPTFLRMLEC